MRQAKGTGDCMYKYIYILIFMLILGITAYYIIQKEVKTTINYFPIDETTSFQNAETTLDILQTKKEDEMTINWHIQSETEKPLYLRQDISLLYENGKFKGALSKWEENTKNIETQKTFTQNDHQHYQTISFHHGEIHEGKKDIKSIQTMSSDERYIVAHDDEFITFKQPKNDKMQQWKEKLDHLTNERVTAHWEELFNYYDIQQNDYYLIPITKLYAYNEQPLPSFTMNESQKIIGQLWEGLYKNYLLPITQMEEDHKAHYIPIVLLRKDKTHLLVLFELNGKKQKLKQKI